MNRALVGKDCALALRHVEVRLVEKGRDAERHTGPSRASCRWASAWSSPYRAAKSASAADRSPDSVEAMRTEIVGATGSPVLGGGSLALSSGGHRKGVGFPRPIPLNRQEPSWTGGRPCGKRTKPSRPLGVGLLASALGLAPPACAENRPLAASARPKAFGTQDHTITVLSALEFLGCSLVDAATLSRFCCETDESLCTQMHYHTTLDLPAGSVIDYIGVNTATTVDAAMGFTLHLRDNLGGTAQLASFSFPAHGFGTDYAGPLGILIPANIDRVFVLDVEVAPGLVDNQFFGYVEIWWRRVVSDPPATPTFGDVPASHPFYQFIEALAYSGITGGCGGGNYCADAPLTRGQMAVFLSKALGLHWPE